MNDEYGFGYLNDQKPFPSSNELSYSDEYHARENWRLTSPAHQFPDCPTPGAVANYDESSDNLDDEALMEEALASFRHIDALPPSELYSGSKTFRDANSEYGFGHLNQDFQSSEIYGAPVYIERARDNIFAPRRNNEDQRFFGTIAPVSRDIPYIETFMADDLECLSDEQSTPTSADRNFWSAVCGPQPAIANRPIIERPTRSEGMDGSNATEGLRQEHAKESDLDKLLPPKRACISGVNFGVNDFYRAQVRTTPDEAFS